MPDKVPYKRAAWEGKKSQAAALAGFSPGGVSRFFFLLSLVERRVREREPPSVCSENRNTCTSRTHVYRHTIRTHRTPPQSSTACFTVRRRSFCPSSSSPAIILSLASCFILARFTGELGRVRAISHESEDKAGFAAGVQFLLPCRVFKRTRAPGCRMGLPCIRLGDQDPCRL